MRLFCYGTLMFPEVMQRLIGSHHDDGVTATLPDYGCYIVNGYTFPGIVHEEGAVTRGIVYAGIGEHSLARLDRYEGDCYERARVCVTDPGGNPLQAWAYIIPTARRGMLSRRQWDGQVFERQHLKAYLHTVLAG